MTEQKKKAGAPVLLSHAYWDAEGARHEAGTVVELPLTEAKAMIKSGKAERADPMPGEG